MNPPLHSTRIGKYQLIATLGRGGMAHIHLARLAGPMGFNKLFVIKVLREDLSDGHDDCITMFLDEARLAARLSHPNIVQTFDVGDDDGRYFIAMEYLEGQCLRVAERRLGPALSVAHHLRVLSEVGKGLHHAHELLGYDGEPLHVVHRDVSPQNVFLTYDGQVKLLDFGIAKFENAVHLTRVGIIKGKAEYIAPEQVRGEQVDRRADVFALGVMMYEALSSQRFAGGPGIADVSKLHTRATGGERPLRQICPTVPERLAQICERAIALEPRHRHASALEFARDIDAWLAERPPLPTAHDLAERLAAPFQAERERLRKLIDAQMLSDGDQLALLELRENSRSLGGRKSLTPVGERAAQPGTPLRVSEAAPSSGSSGDLLATPARLSQRPNNLVLGGAVALSVLLGALATYLTMQPAAPTSAERSVSTPVAAPLGAAAPQPPRVTAPIAPSVQAHQEPRVREPAPRSEPAPRPTRKRGGRVARAARAVEALAAQPAAPAPARVEREADVEPGADFRSITPTRRKTGELELELEENAYE